MSDGTGISWADATWNPVVGCTKVSDGCKNCYAMKMAQRVAAAADAKADAFFARSGGSDKQPTERQMAYRQVVKRDGEGLPLPQWNNRVVCIESALTEPLSWRKPALVFVNSMSDLFHEDVPVAFIGGVYAVMAQTPHLTYQILTKRPGRMADVLPAVQQAMMDILAMQRGGDSGVVLWPLPNVWHGVSAENQATWDERVPHLLRCPSAVRFVSVEPLLGEIDLSAFFGGEYVALPGDRVMPNYNFGIDWLIVGCESNGQRAGRFGDGYEAAARSIIAQCREAGVRVFHKQMPIGGRVSHDLAEWPADLRVREWPEVKG